MRILVAMFALSLTLSAQTKPAAETSDASSGHLPVRRVVLYKNGVGYFEHTGRVRGSEEVNIDFTTSQLDDVLKSLTVVDLGEGRVTGVRYNSIAPLDQRLHGLRLPLGEKPTREELLNALLGARVEVRNGSASATGKILSVETTKRTNERTDDAVEVSMLSIVTDSGELRTFDLTPATSVRIIEHDLNQELNRYFGMVGSSRAKDVRRMTIATAGSGDRDMLVSYVSEVPVWKTTYRIVIPPDPKRQPLLQGWAVVDNTIGEDWKDVKLSLVAGAPQSFIQQISTPLYARRPVIALPETAQLTPQMHEAALEVTSAAPAAGLPPTGGPDQSVNGNAGGGVGSGYGGGVGGGSYRVGGGAADKVSRSWLNGCSVGGIVYDPAGAIVSGASVNVKASNGNFHATTDSSGSFCINGVAQGSAALRFDARGFKTVEMRDIRVGAVGVRLAPTLPVGSSSEVLDVTGAAPMIETDTSINGASFQQLTSIGPALPGDAVTRNVVMEQQFQSAAGRELGELFSYDIKQPITIGKDQSALVPIVQARVDSQKVTIWNATDIPRRALWIINTSGATLDSGSFTVIEGDSFAGEGLMDPIKPAERRLLSYAADQSIHVASRDEAHNQPITHVRIYNGAMTLTRTSVNKRTYEIRNADKEERHVVVEHPLRDGWTLAKGMTPPSETTASLYRFLVDVKPGETSKFDVSEQHADYSTVLLTNLNSDLILYYSQQNVLRPEVEKAFRSILDQKAVIANYDEQLGSRQQEINTISSDQSRVRENMKALKGSAEEKALVQRYATEMNAQEDRLGTLRVEMISLREKRDQASQQLDKMLTNIEVDDSL
jgi:hypothetical protein